MTKQVVMAIDLVLVVLFAAIGRASHDESILSGLVRTAWPFIVACLVAWVVLLVRRRPVGTIGSGVFIWLVTAWGGLALRWASHSGGVALSFCIVATVALGLFLVGWRLLLRRRLAVTA